MTNYYQVIETTLRDGTVAYRFIRGNTAADLAYARQIASNFMVKADVRDCRIFVASADEVRAMRALAALRASTQSRHRGNIQQ